MRIVLLLVLAAALAPTALAAPAAHVRLAGSGVLGAGFHPRERVVVTVRTGSSHWTKTVVTTDRGTFTARFTLPVGSAGCPGFSVLAVGAKGERAAWKSPPRPCANPIGP
jgi:hypothetical protein